MQSSSKLPWGGRMSLHINSISQIRGEEKFILYYLSEAAKKEKNNLILYNYQNSWLLVQPALQDNEDNDHIFIGTWWKQSFSLGLTRTSTAQMFPDDDNANDDSSATMMMTIC